MRRGVVWRASSRGVVGGGGEEDFGAGVGGDAVAEVAGELAEVLVGEGDGDAEAVGFGENVFEWGRGG